MTTKKVIYFTAGALPTLAEAAEIAVLQLASTKPFDLLVRRADSLNPADYSYGSGAEPCDYIAGSPPSGIPAIDVAASKAGTFSAPGTAADTITIGGVVYTLRASVTTIANEVAIGASAADTATALAAAINAGAGAGVLYGSLTVANPVVTAEVEGAVVTVTAKTPGAGGNAITISESGTGFSWAGGATTLSGGGQDGYYDLRPLVITSGSGDTATVTTVDGDLTSLVLS